MRRMIPQKFIDWIKKLFNNVQPNGDDVEFGRNIEVDGKIKTYDKLVDENGNYRFISGNLEVNPSLSAGVTITYAKWALSGNSLTLAINGKLDAGASMGGSLLLASATLPQWIMDNLIPDKEPYLDRKYYDFTIAGYNITNQGLTEISKQAGKIYIESVSGISSGDSDRYFRIAYTFVIA